MGFFKTYFSKLSSKKNENLVTLANIFSKKMMDNNLHFMGYESSIKIGLAIFPCFAAYWALRNVWKFDPKWEWYENIPHSNCYILCYSLHIVVLIS